MNFTAITLSATTVWVAWNEIPPIDQNGIITTYEVLYTPKNNFDGILSSKLINLTDNSGVLEELIPFVNYSISVRAYTTAGAGLWSEPATATTQQDRKFTNSHQDTDNIKLCYVYIAQVQESH